MTPSERWVRFADRHRRALLLVAVLCSALGLWGTVRLYGDLRPDMSELLPGTLAHVPDEVGTARAVAFLSYARRKAAKLNGVA